jgi:hypothetical protein
MSTEDTRKAPEGATHEVELGIDGPNKRELAGAVLGALQALAAAKGSTLPLATPIIRPDREVEHGIAVSDEGYRFETNGDVVTVYAPDLTRIGEGTQDEAERLAGAHWWGPRS